MIEFEQLWDSVELPRVLPPPDIFEINHGGSVKTYQVDVCQCNKSKVDHHHGVEMNIIFNALAVALEEAMKLPMPEAIKQDIEEIYNDVNKMAESDAPIDPVVISNLITRTTKAQEKLAELSNHES